MLLSTIILIIADIEYRQLKWLVFGREEILVFFLLREEKGMVWRFGVVVVVVVVVMWNVGNEKKGGKKKKSWGIEKRADELFHVVRSNSRLRAAFVLVMRAVVV